MSVATRAMTSAAARLKQAKDDFSYSRGNEQTKAKKLRAVETAIFTEQAVRRQIPIAPQRLSEETPLTCGVCQCVVVSHSYGYCPSCGQAILWKEITP